MGGWDPGWATFVGIGFLLFVVPVSAKLGMKLGAWGLFWALLRDLPTWRQQDLVSVAQTVDGRPCVTLLAGQLRRKVVGLTDTRVNQMSELIGGIRIIKFYAWEESFLGRIVDTRLGETKLLKLIALMGAAFGVVMFATPVRPL